jgi:hypothetical protein
MSLIILFFGILPTFFGHAATSDVTCVERGQTDSDSSDLLQPSRQALARLGLRLFLARLIAAFTTAKDRPGFRMIPETV